MNDFLTALALILVIEGSAYALFPVLLKRMAASVADIPESSLRMGGVLAAILGVGAVWIIRT